MSKLLSTSVSNGGLSVLAYPGDGSILIAMNLDEHLLTDLAGFAVRRLRGDGTSTWLSNRLTFPSDSDPRAAVSGKTTAATRKWTPSPTAPFQKFRWVDFPPDAGADASYTYEVSAMYFTNGQFPLRIGAVASVGVNLSPTANTKLQVGFTRGYLSSQAYTDLFKNAAIAPSAPRTQVAFDSKPFQAQYAWLGYHGRKLVFDFLNAALQGGKYLDVFVFDIDEPDVVSLFEQFKDRLRIIVDDHLDAGKTALKYDRADAIARCSKSAGASNVARTMFQRFSHDKVFVSKDNPDPASAVSVLAGSANFSIRGLYVQANSVVVAEDKNAAGLYARVFDIAFKAAKAAGDTGPPGPRGRKVYSAYTSTKASQNWWNMAADGMPKSGASFAPHVDASVSLDMVNQRIKGAKKNVIFAVMQLAGSGDVMDDLRNANQRDDIFTFGMVDKGADAQKIEQVGGKNNGKFASYAYLHGMVPSPFSAEMSSLQGAFGQVIHHKFVVVDFNGAAPVVFSGSSNLASGGEEANGDNLMIIEDPAVATMFAVEGIRLVDHYAFRVAAQNAKSTQPLFLQGPGVKNPWWQTYYDSTTSDYKDRLTFFA